MKTEIVQLDGTITPSSLEIPENAQLFDEFWERKNDGSGNYNSYLLMIRLWVQNDHGYEPHFQLRAFIGGPAERIKVMREYGYES